MRQFKKRRRGENVQVIQQSMVMHHSCSPLGRGVGPGIEVGIVKLYSTVLTSTMALQCSGIADVLVPDPKWS